MSARYQNALPFFPHSALQDVYDTFSEISLVNDVLRISGLAPPLVSSLVTQLRDVVTGFEKLRMFSDYRTPSVIRFVPACLQFSLASQWVSFCALPHCWEAVGSGTPCVHRHISGEE